MKDFSIGNVVKWQGQLYVVADDNGDVVKLIPMNSSNSTSHPSKKWPTEKRGRAAIVYVSETVYGWLVKSMKKNLGIDEALSANGWIPR